MITFQEHASDKYPPRTYANAMADVTIAFAFDFKTKGELLTQKAVKANGKFYFPIDPILIDNRRIKTVSTLISDAKFKAINIAGNSASTNIQFGYSQKRIDLIVYNFLYEVFNHPTFDAKIELIRSGGQSGFDEAGIKAAVRLGIPALILCPKGWKFKNENGKTICDEHLFKSRFN